jgi:hypothetical protein
MGLVLNRSDPPPSPKSGRTPQSVQADCSPPGAPGLALFETWVLTAEQGWTLRVESPGSVLSVLIRAKSVADFPKSPENCATPKPSHNIVFNLNTRPYRAQENLSGVVRCTTKTGAGAQRRHP